MGKTLKNIIVLFGPYLYFAGILLLFLDKIGIGIISILIGAICTIFARIYCIYHVIKHRSEIKDIWVLHLILLLLLGIMYVPIYYVYYVMKKNIVFGILGALVYPIVIVGLVIVGIIYGISNSTGSEYTIHTTKDELVSVSLPKNYTCKTTTSYSIECSDDKGNILGLINLSDEDDTADFDYYYNSIYSYYNERYVVENENRNYRHASFDFSKMGYSYIAIIDEKILDEKVSTVVVYICKEEAYSDYNRIYSSVGLALYDNLV